MSDKNWWPDEIADVINSISEDVNVVDTPISFLPNKRTGSQYIRVDFGSKAVAHEILNLFPRISDTKEIPSPRIAPGSYFDMKKASESHVGFNFSADPEVRSYQVQFLIKSLPAMAEAIENADARLLEAVGIKDVAPAQVGLPDSYRKLASQATSKYGKSIDYAQLSAERSAQIIQLLGTDLTIQEKAGLMLESLPPQDPRAGIAFDITPEGKLGIAKGDQLKAIQDEYDAVVGKRKNELSGPPVDKYFDATSGDIVEKPAGYMIEMINKGMAKDIGPGTMYDLENKEYRSLDQASLDKLQGIGSSRAL